MTLAAVAVLAVNDWLLKPRFGPSLVTGKLSDLAGLTFAPVVLSAAIGLALQCLARLGARVEPSLSRRRLLACTLATGAVFTAVKLSPQAAALLAAALSHLGRPASIYLDPTDLLCLPCLLVAIAIGRDELRRVPLGLPASAHRLALPASAALASSRWAGASPTHLAALAAAIDRWDVPRIDALLAA